MNLCHLTRHDRNPCIRACTHASSHLLHGKRSFWSFCQNKNLSLVLSQKPNADFASSAMKAVISEWQSPRNMLPPLLVTISQPIMHLRSSPNYTLISASLTHPFLESYWYFASIIHIPAPWLSVAGTKGIWQVMRFTVMSSGSELMRTTKEQQTWWAGLAMCLSIFKSLKLFTFQMTLASGNNIS